MHLTAVEVQNGYQALRRDAAWIDLSNRGKIRVTGEDRARLLHAMSTNNVQQLAGGHGQYAFFLNDKGRILADAYILNLGDSLFLDTEPETARKLYEHLDRYLIADDATLTDETDTLAAVGLEGPRAVSILRELGFSLPLGDFGCEPSGDVFVAALSASGSEGMRVFLPAGEKASLIGRFEAAGARQAHEAEVRTVRLENAMARYGEDISERYLVQETRVANAVHPNKGCYLGQEIVERVRSRGQVHRLLVPIRIEIKDAPPSGTKLRLEGADVGEITSAAFSPELGEVVGLAYVRTEVVDRKSTVELGGAGDLPVAVFLR